MTVTLHIEIRLSRQDAAVEPHVQVWLDRNGDQRMDEDEEVRPLTREGLLWRGQQVLPALGPSGIGLLARVRGVRGARYRLRVWQDDGTSRQLAFEEADTVADDPHRIIGWCRT